MYLLRLFGGACLEGEAGPISGRVAQQRPLAVLAILAVAREKGCSREKLIGCLWAEADQERARHRLANVVYELRKSLGEKAVLASGEVLRLNPEVIKSDVWVFEDAVDTDDLESAAGLYGGPFLDGFYVDNGPEFERWVEGERRRLADRCTEALESLADRAWIAGDHRNAAAWWKRLNALDPYNSRYVRRLMEALVAVGDPANALELLRVHELRLRDELKLELPEELRALADQLRAKPVAKREVFGEAVQTVSRTAESMATAQDNGLLAARDWALPVPLRELLKRRVPQVLLVYLVASWAAVEFIDLLVQRQTLWQQSVDLAIVVLLSLVPSVLLVSYFHGGSGRQEATTFEKTTVGLNVVGAMALAFLLLEGGDVAIRDPGDRILRREQITFSGQAHRPAFSPDGSAIAYLIHGPADSTTLVVQSTTGGTPRHLTTAAGIYGPPRWSPDGQMVGICLLHESVRWLSYGFPLDGGPRQKLAHACIFTWSPDGSEIAYAYESIYDTRRFTVVNLEKTEERSIPIAVGQEWLAELAWSPSGNEIGFLTRNTKTNRHSISTITIDGREQRTLVEDSSKLFSLRWSGDGHFLYFGSGHQLRRVAVWAGSATRPQVSRSELVADEVWTDFSISSDETRLAYDRPAEIGNLWRIDIDDESGTHGSVGRTRLTSSTSRKTSATISPDGQSVAYVDLASGGALFIVPAFGGPIRQVVSQIGDVQIDGLAWSPDGSSLAYVSQGDDPKVTVVSASGGTPRQYGTSGPHAGSDVTWCPGSGILYQLPGNKDFRFLDTETGAERSLLGASAFGWLRAARCSPDGKKVAVLWNRKPHGLWVISLVDSSQLYLSFNTVPIGWTDDGNWVIARKYDGDEVMQLQAEEATSRRLPRFTIDNARIQEVAVARDLSFAVVIAVESLSDIWLINNLDQAMR